MTAAELDEVYTLLCSTMTPADEAGLLQSLGRFALLAMLEIDDAERIKALIARAAKTD